MPEPLVITLFGKPDCHLCDEAEALVMSVTGGLGNAYRKVDILSRPDLYEAYRYRIPVVQVGGGPTLDWPFTPGQLRRAVQAAARP
jgi:hypothetical protein